MTQQNDFDAHELPLERRCEACQEMRRVIARVGPLLIKEPCPHKCAAGYAKQEKSK